MTFNLFLFIFLLSTYFKVPEIQGRIFEEITQIFKRHIQVTPGPRERPSLDLNNLQPRNEKAAGA